MPRSARILVALALAGSTLAVGTPVRGASAQLGFAKRCRKAFDVQGRLYAFKRQGLLLSCGDKFLKCELLHEVDGQDPSDCRAAVTDACTKRLGPQPESAMSKAQLRFDLKVPALCLSADFPYADILSASAGGLWFGTDAACGGSIDLPTFVPCLRGEMEVGLDALVSELKPRTALLLDNAGLGGGYPNLTRPPMVDVLVAATAPASGALVDPGTLGVPLASALRFTGDASTLSCTGSSNNGRLTITIGSGPTAEEHTLREPYGPGELAIFGPYTTAGTRPYTIDFKDGSCQDTVSGTVSVP